MRIACLDALSLRLDQKVEVQKIHRRLQTLSRFLIVSTFIDDAVRVVCDYEGQVDSMETVGFGRGVARALPLAFAALQAAGAALVLRNRSPLTEAGCVALALWSTAHPFLYLQHKNIEFVAESGTTVGGLLILLSSVRATRRDRHPAAALDGSGLAEQTDRLQLAGRTCLSALFVFYLCKMARERFAYLSGASPLEAPGVAAVEGVLLVLLAALTGLIVAGLRSRLCALLLAAVTGAAAFYMHPWYITIWSHRKFTLDGVIGYEGLQVPAWLYSNHQRYFFFEQLSTAGALLQLVVHGPGKYSVDEADGPLPMHALTSKGVD